MSSRHLNVLHFSATDTLGGSARSAYRIHTGLRMRGHRSRMLVGHRLSTDPDVQRIANSASLHFVDRCADRLSGMLGYQYSLVPSSRRVRRHKWLRDAHIIQLFNTHGGYFAQDLLPLLAKHAPLVWRLSDLWPMTGHCAYPGSCSRWLSGCGDCPALDSYPAIGRDRTAALFQRKQSLYAHLPLTIVAPSSWTEQQARLSPMLQHVPVYRIPNGVDGEVFAPASRSKAREQLGMPQDARVLLFSAHMLDANPRKGGDVLLQALQSIGARSGWHLALLGEGGGSWQAQCPIPVHRLGFRSDATDIARCYAVADVVVVPSVLENLPNTLLEALACGRAVVASDCGGIRDGVIDGTTGLLVPQDDAVKLAAALIAILTNNALQEQMERNARELFEREFSAALEIDRFEALYRRVIERSGVSASDPMAQR